MSNHYNFKMSRKIPKKIWQTGFNSFDELQYPFNKNLETWQILNPDWEYSYTDEPGKVADIEKFGNKSFIELSHLVKGPFLADLWRYIMVYQHGGVYVDLDSVCWLPLDILSYSFTTDKTTMWTSPEIQGSGYINNTGSFYTNQETTASCDACYKLHTLLDIKEGENKEWMGNGVFAAYKECTPLKNVLDEVEYRFNLFKKLHEGSYDETHSSLITTVDCSAYHAGLHRDMSEVSRTFINDMQSFRHPDFQGVLFKDYFIDYSMWDINKQSYSHFKGSIDQ